MAKEEEDEKENLGSGEGLGDLIQQIAACEDFGLHKTTLAWPCLHAYNVLQVARNWQQPHQDWTCLMIDYLVSLNLLQVVADKGYIREVQEQYQHFHDDYHSLSDKIFRLLVTLLHPCTIHIQIVTIYRGGLKNW